MTYLKNGEYTKDPENHLFSLDLAKQAMLGNNPIQWYVSKKLKRPKRFRWLTIVDEVYIEKVLISDHGHKGINGARGSLMSTEKSISRSSVTAHSHTPGRIRSSMQVGMTTKEDCGYNRGGYSSWFGTSGVIYLGGAKTLVNSINGEYTGE